MEPSDGANSGPSTSFNSSTSSVSEGSRNQVVDNTDAVNAGGSPTCLCGHRVGTSGEPISVTVAPTTGGQFELKVSKLESIDNLKKAISKRLKVPKERICLLWKDRHLREGTLRDNGICDGSRLTLLPSVETGLLTQRPEQSVMQALESLNDGQVNDFLSGKAPLNLTMRLGDHMMLIQLQLSAVAPTASSTHRRPPVSHIPSTSSRPLAPSSSAPSQSSSQSSSNGHPWAGTGACTSLDSVTASPISGLAQPVLVPGVVPGAGLSAMLNAPLRQTLPATPLAVPETPVLASPRSPSPLLSAELSKAGESTPPPVTPSTSSSPKADGASLGCGAACVGCETCDTRPVLDTRALAEASRNLTQTLKQLSSEVLTSRSSNESSGRSRRRQGAIIESMHHHGKGVYSGTFSGTLNPALQDRQGRPKRDISTIIHILNDLLCATPQYRRVLSAQTSTTSTAPAAGSSTRPSPTPMEQDDASISAAAQMAAAAAAIQRKTPGKAGLPTLLLLREETRRLAEENQATRGKLEQLRMVMEERRARRRARREARVAPYTSWSSKSDASSNPNSCGAPSPAPGSLDCESAASDSSMDTSDTNSTSDLRELNTEPVVA